MSPRYRVLAVDDDEDTLELIRLALEDRYDVLTLATPMEIYECIELFEPDLLIIDIMMPRISGFQLIDLLKKNPKTKDIPIIILSAKDSIREIKYGYKLGAALYLTKPFAPERLMKNTETQFRMHPPEVRPKSLSLDQVRIRLEVTQGSRAGQIALSSSLLTSENVRGRQAGTAGEGKKGKAGSGRTRAGEEEQPEPESGGPHWEG